MQVCVSIFFSLLCPCSQESSFKKFLFISTQLPTQPSQPECVCVCVCCLLVPEHSKHLKWMLFSCGYCLNNTVVQSVSHVCARSTVAWPPFPSTSVAYISAFYNSCNCVLDVSCLSPLNWSSFSYLGCSSFFIILNGIALTICIYYSTFCKILIYSGKKSPVELAYLGKRMSTFTGQVAFQEDFALFYCCP